MRAGRVRLWVPLVVLFWALVWIVASLADGVEAAGFTTVDTRRARLAVGAPIFDPRWEEALAEALAREPSFSATDRSALERVTARIASLPFVAAVGTASVLWPDSFDVDVRLRTPVACVKRGESYWAVSEDGVLLPGDHSAPPWLANGFLPVIGPNDGSFDRARAGDVLREPRHVDALAVADSMRRFLGAADFEVMGPPLIDATLARAASPTEPGVRIKLAERRIVLFGRSPTCGEPGELPAENKWTSLSRALHRLVDPATARDWTLLDVRWDVPEIQWRDPSGE